MSVLTLTPARTLNDSVSGRLSRRLMPAATGSDHRVADQVAGSQDDEEAQQEESGNGEQSQAQEQQVQRPFRCQHPGCSKAFKKRNKLNRHVLSHSNERKHSCQHPGCDKRFLRSEHLAAHQQTHSGPSSEGSGLKSFVCSHQICQDTNSICGKRFPTKQKLERHIGSVHEILPPGEVADGRRNDAGVGKVPEKQYSCDNAGCNLVFRKRKHLRAHIWDIHSDAPHLSPYSTAHDQGEALASASSPVPTDLQKRPFACSWPGCTMRFPSNSHRRIHEKRHEAKKAKVYTCALSHPDIPQAEVLTFSTWSLLRAHMREVHPPRCPHSECRNPQTGLGRAFKSADGLKAHLKRHEEREALLAAQEKAQSEDDNEADLDEDEEGAQNSGTPNTHGDPNKTGYRFACTNALPDGTVCHKRFKTSRALDSHRRVFHLGERRFQCTRGCGKRFGYKHTQERHEAAGKCAPVYDPPVETPNSEMDDDYFREEGGAVPQRDSARGESAHTRSVPPILLSGTSPVLSKATSSIVKAAAGKLMDLPTRKTKTHMDRARGTDAYQHPSASSPSASTPSLFQLLIGEGYAPSADATAAAVGTSSSAVTQSSGAKRAREDETPDDNDQAHDSQVKRRRKTRERNLACPWRRIVELGRAAKELESSGASGNGEALSDGTEDEPEVEAADAGDAPDCAFRFSRMYDLRRHVLSKHGVDLTRFDKQALSAIMAEQ